jgi:hypothetical protein
MKIFYLFASSFVRYLFDSLSGVTRESIDNSETPDIQYIWSKIDMVQLINRGQKKEYW